MTSERHRHRAKNPVSQHIYLAAMLIGAFIMGMGVAGGVASAKEPAPAPAAVVEQVEVVPLQCLDALGRADQMLGILTAAMRHAQAMEFIESKRLYTTLDADGYLKQKETCRNWGK